MKLVHYVFLLSALGIGLSHCGKKKSDSSSAASSVANNLSLAFPGSLAISVFSTSSTNLALADSTAYDPAAVSIKDKVDEASELLGGEAKSCLPKALAKSFTKNSDETCYEFDQDMIYGTNDSSKASPKYLGTKNGKNSAGEACLVAFTRNQVSQAIAIVDQTLGFGMSALCQAKKLNSGVDLPAVGDTLDLKAAMEDLFGAKMTVTSATLERLSDYTDDNGKTRKLFRILITSTVEADGITRTVGIVHSPVDDENKEYSGTLYTSMNGEVGEGKQGKLASSSMTRMMSIVYAKVAESDGTSRIKAELRTAQVANSLADTAIGSDGVLNFNVGADLSKALTSQDYGKYTGFAQANDAVNAMTYIAFDLNLTSNAGTLSYWKNPGGNYFENARGFNISIERGSDDVLSGCATTGSASTDFTKGTSIRRYLNSAESANSLTLQAKGDWHPFMNSPSSNSSDTDGDFYLRTQQSGQIAKWYKPTLSDSSLANLFATGSDGSYITHQCFKYDSASGLYLIDTDKITETAGYEVLDSGNTVNKSKFIAPPEIGDAKPIDKVEIKK